MGFKCACESLFLLGCQVEERKGKKKRKSLGSIYICFGFWKVPKSAKVYEKMVQSRALVNESIASNLRSTHPVH